MRHTHNQQNIIHQTAIAEGRIQIYSEDRMANTVTIAKLLGGSTDTKIRRCNSICTELPLD